MKTESFVAGAILGAACAIVISKKFLNPFCTCKASDNSVLKEAENAVETLRGSVETLRTELSKRIESEQTFASRCEDLTSEVEKQRAEIESLKNVCDAQNGCNKKLEEELAQVKSIK